MRFLGKTTDARSRFVYAGYLRPTRYTFGTNKIWYSMGLYPLVSFSYPQRDRNETYALAYGAGISPLGFSLIDPINEHMALRFAARSGMVYLNRFFPTQKGTRLNYTFDLSTSLLWKVTPLVSFSIGYTFHHISNAQTGKENPGLDSNFFSFSLFINPSS
jgi:hypothetical protein